MSEQTAISESAEEVPDPATAALWERVVARAALPVALARYATALRWSFASYLLLIFGIALLPIGIAWKPGRAIAFAAVALLLASAVCNLWGKWRLYKFEVQIRGRWLLGVAFWCDAIVAMSRFFRPLLRQFPEVQGTAIALLVVGFIFFVLFLRSLAEVISRTDLRNRASLVVACILVVAATAGLAALERNFNLLPGQGLRSVKIAVLAVGGLGLITLIIAYGGLLWRMSSALRHVSDFLLRDEDEPAGVLEPQA